MLNENLRNLRKRKGYTQDEIAEKLHIVRQTVSKWETGISVPDANELLTLAEIYEVEVSALLGVKQIPEGRTDLVAEELAKINRQLAARRRHTRLCWKLVLIAGIVIAAAGLLGVGMGWRNYNEVLSDPAYSAETAAVVLQGCVRMMTKGAGRAFVGIVMLAVAGVMRRNM